MLVVKVLSIVGASICAVLLSPALADEFTDSLASMRRAMVGHWSGELSGTAASGEKFEIDDDFTFVVTSDDGLDSATWSASTLEIATYESDGRYRIRNWNRAGRQGEIRYRLRIVEGPDAAGNGAWVPELQQTAADGTVMETREHFELNGNMLTMEVKCAPLALTSRSRPRSGAHGIGHRTRPAPGAEGRDASRASDRRIVCKELIGMSLEMYIFNEWLPSSDRYELDSRERFGVLPPDYDARDPNAQEEIWTPVRTKSRSPTAGFDGESEVR